MIIRLLHAKVRSGKHQEFRKVLELLSLPSLKNRTEMLAVYSGQPVEGNQNEFVLVTVWKELTGMDYRSKEDWIKLILPEEAIPLLEDFYFQGYEAFGVFEKSIKPLFQSI
jgi:hypothetical protein